MTFSGLDDAVNYYRSHTDADLDDNGIAYALLDFILSTNGLEIIDTIADASLRDDVGEHIKRVEKRFENGFDKWAGDLYGQLKEDPFFAETFVTGTLPSRKRFITNLRGIDKEVREGNPQLYLNNRSQYYEQYADVYKQTYSTKKVAKKRAAKKKRVAKKKSAKSKVSEETNLVVEFPLYLVEEKGGKKVLITSVVTNKEWDAISEAIRAFPGRVGAFRMIPKESLYKITAYIDTPTLKTTAEAKKWFVDTFERGIKTDKRTLYIVDIIKITCDLYADREWTMC